MDWLLIFLGLLTRFLLIGVPGFKGDIAFWKECGLGMVDKGIIWLVNNTNFNYPPGFAYVLGLINKIYGLFLNPHNFGQYWLDTNYLYLFLIKSITIIADLGIFFLIIKISKKLDFKWGKLLAFFYFFNVVVFYDGVIWGQNDQFALFFLITSLYLLIIDRPNFATVTFTIGCLMKFQNIIFLPIFFLYVYKKYSFQGLFKTIGYSLLVFAIFTVPFWWNREMASLVKLFTMNSNWYPWYSVNAFNIWWIFSGLKGMAISDKTLFLGVINAKEFGLLMFSFFYFITCLRLFLSKKEDLLINLVLALCLAVLAFFHLLTQSHERYLFPLLGLILVLFIVRKEKNLGFPLLLFLVFSLGILINMYLTVFIYYPDQVYWPFSKMTTQSITLYISWFQIGLFLIFFFKYYFLWLKKYWFYVFTALLIFTGIIFYKNINYLLGKPVPLTELDSISYRQDYLSPMKNMTVESAREVFSWNRLSVNYFFYKSGIGSHADSEINYRLEGRFSRLITDYGIDTEGASVAKAYFLIYGDGRELFRSKVKGQFDNPETTSVSLKGIDLLTLKIIKAEKTNYGVHADWLDPVLIK